MINLHDSPILRIHFTANFIPCKGVESRFLKIFFISLKGNSKNFSEKRRRSERHHPLRGAFQDGISRPISRIRN